MTKAYPPPSNSGMLTFFLKHYVAFQSPSIQATYEGDIKNLDSLGSTNDQITESDAVVVSDLCWSEIEITFQSTASHKDIYIFTD